MISRRQTQRHSCVEVVITKFVHNSVHAFTLFSTANSSLTINSDFFFNFEKHITSYCDVLFAKEDICCNFLNETYS